MHTAVKMPLRSLHPDLVRELKEQFPNGQLHIVVEGQPAAAGEMNEDRFWEIIGLLDWSKEGNDDAVIEPVVRELAKMPEAAIQSFYDLLSEKLYLLDGRVHAEHSIEENEHLSSDLFLYARCCVVANGRAFYEEVLANPTAFPKDLYFEAILDIPERAWLRKTGGEFDYFPKYFYETGFNPSGWGADTIIL